MSVIDTIKFRWQLLQELFGKALGKLSGRQQEILRLEREGYSPPYPVFGALLFDGHSSFVSHKLE